MRKKLMLVGAGGLGRTVHAALIEDPAFAEQYELYGFLDTRAELVLPPQIQTPVVGCPLSHVVQEDEVFMVAVGLPEWRRQLIAPLQAQGARFISATRGSCVGPRSQVGNGSFLAYGALVSVDCELGEFSYLDTYVIVGHDVVMGDHCTLGAMCFVAGGVRIGHGVSIHPRATIGKGVRIGDGATVGIGAVVVNDVAPGVTVFGNPARAIF
jgi:sugar O-acyltransferase (sialic acid O-acetyltransferase NeuD family)